MMIKKLKSLKNHQILEIGGSNKCFISQFDQESKKERIWLIKDSLLESHLIYTKQAVEDIEKKLLSDDKVSKKEIEDFAFFIDEKLLEYIKVLHNQVEFVDETRIILDKATEDLDINTLISLAKDLYYGVPIYIIYEKVREVWGGKINRFIVKRKDSVKSEFLFEDKVEIDIIPIPTFNKSLNAPLKLGIGIKNISTVFFDDEKETKISDSLYDLAFKDYEDPETRYLAIKSKPMKGLPEAIIIRLFLADNLTDMKLENIIAVDKGRYFQAENIDFSNVFVFDWQLNENIFDIDVLLRSIYEINDLAEKEDFELIDILKKNIGDFEKEIKDTIKTISSLTDEDLKSLIYDSDIIDKELIPKEELGQYLDFLIYRRDLMMDLG